MKRTETFLFKMQNETQVKTQKIDCKAQTLGKITEMHRQLGLVFLATSSNLGRKFGLPVLRPVRMCGLRLFEHTGQRLSAYWHFIVPDTLLLFLKRRSHFLAEFANRTQPGPTKPRGYSRALIHLRGHRKKDLSCWKPESVLGRGLAEATALCIKCRWK